MGRELKGKVVVLTGASRGIGRAIAVDLAGAGASLVLVARDRAGLEATAEAVRGAGGTATLVMADVSSPADRQRILEEAEAVGPVDVLVNNAGVEVPVSVVDHRAEDVTLEIAVNLVAPIELTRMLLPKLIARGTGVVAMLSSMSGKSPTPYNAVYAATKHGLNGFTGSLRIELDGTGVHVGVCCPGFVADAGMWQDSGESAPFLFREVSLARVVAGVRAVIDGKGEVLVAPGPVRPLLALAQVFPRLDATLLRRMGVVSVMSARAKKLAAERG